jgi:MoaA/NifB/PqqE/SkfB family radical SAM enzyme
MLAELAKVGRSLGDRARRGVLGRLGMAPPPRAPHTVNWDLTYACPLRCGHCYSESGRRSARQLPLEDLLRIADVLLAIDPIPTVTFSGGEPILVKGMLELARKLKRGGARLVLYTSGYRLSPELAAGIAETFDRISVSIDGADAPTNDFLRERPGAFDEALRALALFDEALPGRGDRAENQRELAIEITVMNSNWQNLERFCTEIAPRFEALDCLRFGALIPTGFASRESFVRRELLSEEQMRDLGRRARRLQKLAPRGVRVRVFSNLPFLLHPAQIRRGVALDGLLKIEANGRVRGMDIYEGTVGHVLEEPFETIWRRSLERHEDPFVVGQLTGVRTMEQWARACRAIDLHFAAPEDKARITARPAAGEVPDAIRVPAPTNPSKRRRLDLFLP